MMNEMDVEQTQAAAAAGGGILLMISLVVMIFIFACFWKIFTKAGKPGWAALIPIYNIFVLLQIVGKPAWWIILFFLPFINAIASILVSLALAEKFGKGAGYAVGLIFLPFIFYPMLAFGGAQYKG